MRTAVFAGGLATNPRRLRAPRSERLRTSAFELYSYRFGVLSLHDALPISGGGTAVRAATGPRHEAMLSLKILR
jgi:hypothetical protein